MDGYIDVLVSGLNTVGRGFCDYAAAMFLQVGMLVAVLLMLDLLLRRRIRATVRYWIWMLVFLKLLLPPGLSLPTGIGYWCGGHFSMLPAGGNDRFVERGTIAELVASDAGRPTTRAAQPQPSDERAAVSPEDVVARGGKMAEAGESLPVAQEHFTWQAVVFLLWGGGVLTLVGWVVRRLLFVKRLIAESTSANEDVREVLGRCRRRIGIRRQIELRLSPGALGPAVCGLVQPIILMPKALLERLPPEQLEPVLIHELAHIKRADLWVNCLQTALQIIYFYNPLVWLANAIVRRVREQAVDEMTLVALGAEAGSYGRTLIDIAEMTFLRPAPALGLVGVAESRKSLEGRIKHMIARPIPKTARVGGAGALAILAAAALMLPMAAAQTETTASRFTAHLSRGTAVELVGVCNWPTPEPICWKADGSPLAEPLRVTKWNLHPSPNSHGFIVKVTGPNDFKFAWKKIEGADDWEGSCDVVDRQGKRLENYTAAVVRFKTAPTETVVEVGLAAGPWRTISSHDVKEPMHVDRSGVLWSQTFESRAGTSIVASTEWDRSRAERIVAIDLHGVVHTTGEGGSIAAGGVEQFTAHFPDLKPAQIRQFQYQDRPYEWATFENVSLHPGFKTEPQVQPSPSSPETRSEASKDAPAGPTPSSTAQTHDLLPNLFVLAPAQIGPPLFAAVQAKARDWTWNKTGRDLAPKSCAEIFDGTHRRTDHDVLVLLFALDREERIPADYEDLLPQPWAQIHGQLERGEIVELSGKARDLNVVVLAAPRAEQLAQAIADSRVLNHPKDLLGSSGQGCDVAIENCRVAAVPDRGTCEAYVSIRNRGRAASPQFIVTFCLGDPGTNRPMIHGAGPIRAGDVWNESSQPFGLKEGVNQVSIALDPAGLMDELDKTNNRVLLTVEVRDGQIVKQTATSVAAPGVEQKITPRIRNSSVGGLSSLHE